MRVRGKEVDMTHEQVRYRWPNGAQCAVVFSVDPDAESGLVFNKPHEAATQLDEMEERRFDPRVGIPRILRLFERYAVPSTWFIPGFTITHHTEIVKAVQASGCELGAHGNIHEPPAALEGPDDERRVMDEQLAIFQDVLGVRPLGYRAPGGSLTIHTPTILREYGFLYHSNLMGDDIPYFVETPHGPLVEIPTSWQLNDAPFYRHVLGAGNQFASPDRVVGQWIQEFDGMYRENGCYVMIVHPWVTGRASRLAGLERLIRTIRGYPGVWWTTLLDVAKWQLETRQNLDVHVPIPGQPPAP
jgi:peptidoglycan/xylan/chitin deacetylase (PgdA/CDA1 family)